MLNVFTLANGRLFQEEIESADALAHVSPVWVDLEAPTAAEKGWIAGRFDKFSGTFSFDDATPENSKMKVEIDTASVSVLSAAARSSPVRVRILGSMTVIGVEPPATLRSGLFASRSWVDQTSANHRS